MMRATARGTVPAAALSATASEPTTEISASTKVCCFANTSQTLKFILLY